jgi:Gpi18-like mannosyltransferase
MEFTRRQRENILFLVLITMVALLMRYLLFPFESSDYHQFLQGWFTALREGGGFAAVGMNIGDYMPTYLYLLAPLTYFPVSALTAVKLVSTLGDLVLAVAVMKTVNLNFSGKTYGIAAYALVLFLPSVFLNSAVWGQCDAIYTAALVFCVYNLMRGRDLPAVISFSVAFVFKLQAVFLAPFVLLMLLRRKIRPSSLLAFPAVYLAAVLPAAALGRSLKDLLTIYYSQAGQYTLVAMFLPNLYTWLPESTPVYISRAAVLLAGGLVLTALFCLSRKNYRLTKGITVTLALFFALMVPFVLPYMHERYNFPADILSVIFAFYFPRRWYLAAVIQVASAFVVCHNLFQTDFFSIQLLGVVMLFVILLVAQHLVRQISENPGEEAA